jgi:hypothetical protein
MDMMAGAYRAFAAKGTGLELTFALEAGMVLPAADITARAEGAIAP